MARNSAAIRSSFQSLRSLLRDPPSPHINNKLGFSSNPQAPVFKTLTSPFGSQSEQLTKQLRCFCSTPSSSSNLTQLKSDEEFAKSLQKALDDRVPAIFYFTAAWCGPCKLMSPIIQDLSKKYPHVNMYKIDVDQKELESTLSNLKIYSVPTLHFFHNGKKASDMVGADVALLKKTVEDLYK